MEALNSRSERGKGDGCMCVCAKAGWLAGWLTGPSTHKIHPQRSEAGLFELGVGNRPTLLSCFEIDGSHVKFVQRPAPGSRNVHVFKSELRAVRA